MNRETENRLKELEKVGAYEGTQLAQNELVNLSQERRNNLQQEKNILTQQERERVIISQAAEMGVDTAAEFSRQGDSVQRAPGMNDQTQQILSKYGINPNQKVAPRTTTTTRSTTKQGPTTVENIVNTTTTNHNVVRVIQPNIPIKQPNISTNGAASNAKFKSWLQRVNAQQEELANSQMNDYNRREQSLLRSTNQMMRKIQELSKTIGRGLDPENMTNTVSGSLKTLLFLFIGSIIPTVWKPLMSRLEGFEANFRSFFGMDLPGNLKTRATTVRNWKSFLGLDEKDLDEYGVPGAVGKLIKSSFEELLAKLEHEKNDRMKAISKLDGERPNSFLDLSGWLNYLGKVAVAAIGGSELQATYTEGNRIQEEKVEEIEKEEFTLEGRKISMLGEFDKDGNLRDEDSALKLTQSLANETQKDIVDISKIQTSLEKLRSFSKKQDKLIPLSPEFVNKIKEIVPEERILSLIEKYKGKGEYRVNQDDYIFTTRKSDYNPEDHYSIWDRVKQWSETGSKAGAVAGGVVGALPTAGFGIVSGGAIGYMLGGLAGGAVGVGHGLADAAAAYFKAPGGQLTLVPISSLTEEQKNQANFHKNYAKANVEEVSPEFLNELFGIAENNAGKNAFKTDNYSAIEKTFVDKGKKTVADAKYLDAVKDSQTLKMKKVEEDQKNTVSNNFSKNLKRARENKENAPREQEEEFSGTEVSQKTPEPTKRSKVNTTADKDATAKTIVEYLMKKLGITQEQAAGIAGNLYIESGGFNLAAHGDKGTSFGLAQWHNERKQALFDYTGTSENNPPTLEQQLDFLIYELMSSEKAALKALKKVTSVRDSALTFAKKFERPATGPDGLPLHFDKRWGFAERFYKLPVHGDRTIPETYMADNITPTNKTESTTLTVASNITPVKSNNSEEKSLGNLVSSTERLAKATEVLAKQELGPRKQIVINNSGGNINPAAPQMTNVTPT